MTSKNDFALNNLKKSLKFCKGKSTEDGMEFLYTAVSSIEKQIPCEPKFNPPNYYCKKCGSFVVNRMHLLVENTPVYCAWCGQRLRW